MDGKEYTVQYFERAVFEMHPENQPPTTCCFSQLGTFRYGAEYGQGSGVTATPAPSGRPTATSVPQATPTGGVPEVSLTLRERAIVPNQVEIAAGRTRFVVNNDSGGTHNLQVLDLSGCELGGTPNFARGAVRHL